MPPIDNQNTDPTPDYLRAFISLMLFKLGGSQTIPLKLLKKFPAEKKSIEMVYNAKTESYTLKLTKQRRRGIIIPKGIEVVKSIVSKSN